MEYFGTRLTVVGFCDRIGFSSEETMMTKNETIALIIESIVSTGYSDADKFVEYVTMILPMMSTEELQSELACLE